MDICEPLQKGMVHLGCVFIYYSSPFIRPVKHGACPARVYNIAVRRSANPLSLFEPRRPRNCDRSYGPQTWTDPSPGHTLFDTPPTMHRAAVVPAVPSGALLPKVADWRHTICPIETLRSGCGWGRAGCHLLINHLRTWCDLLLNDDKARCGLLINDE